MATQRQVIAIIPARHGSTRLPGKPLADIGGKPMIQHVHERVSRAKLVTRVMVATDDDEVASVVHDFEGDAALTPVELASGTDRVAYVAKTFPPEFIIVNVQGDEPFIAPEAIDAAVQPLLHDATLGAATVATKLRSKADLNNPSVVKVVLSARGDALYFSRSPIPYNRDGSPDAPVFKHLGIYAFRNSFLYDFTSWKPTPLEKAEQLEQLRILEHNRSIRVSITAFDSIAVDTPEDLERARKAYAENSAAGRGGGA